MARQPHRSEAVLNNVLRLRRRGKHACREREKPTGFMLDELAESPLVTGPHLRDKGLIRIVARPRHGASVARVAGQGVGDLAVELALLLGFENFTHVEDMPYRCFLQIAHTRMHLVDRGRNLGTVLVLIFHRLGEPGIGCARRSFEPCPFDSETSLERIETLLLVGRQGEFVVHEIVEAGASLVIGPAVRGNRAEASCKCCEKHRENDMRRLQTLLLHMEERRWGQLFAEDKTLAK